MSFRGVAVSVLVLTGGLAAVPVAAMAQTAPDPAAPAAATEAPAQVAPNLDADATAREEQAAAAAGCPSEDEKTDETITDQLAATPEAEAAVARADDPDGPLAHCAQNAGDEQYKDPFAGSEPPKAGGGTKPAGQGSPSSDGGDVGSATPAVLAQQSSSGSDDPAAAAAAAADPGSGLPNTGLDAGLLVAAGLALLVTGAALRRRVA